VIRSPGVKWVHWQVRPVLSFYPGGWLLATATSSLSGLCIKSFIETTFAEHKPAINLPFIPLYSQVVLDRKSLVTYIMLVGHLFRPPKRQTLVYTCPSNPFNYLPLQSLTFLNPTHPPKSFLTTFSPSLIPPNPNLLLSVSPPNLAKSWSPLYYMLLFLNPRKSQLVILVFPTSLIRITLEHVI
jgi:hypothetical protein